MEGLDVCPLGFTIFALRLPPEDLLGIKGLYRTDVEQSHQVLFDIECQGSFNVSLICISPCPRQGFFSLQTIALNSHKRNSGVHLIL